LNCLRTQAVPEREPLRLLEFGDIVLEPIRAYPEPKTPMVTPMQGYEMVIDCPGNVDFLRKAFVAFGAVQFKNICAQRHVPIRLSLQEYYVSIILWPMKKSMDTRHGRHCVFNIRQYIEQQQRPEN
jgi:hypothetical protein